VIQASELSKRYGSTLALDRLNLAIPAGSAFGLLGPNGAGKSTFIKLLLELNMPDSGHLVREGVARQQIGYLPERPAMPIRSRVGEYLTLIGRLSGLGGRRLHSTVEQRLVQVGLRRAAGIRIGACSKGMLQRLGLAVALIADPPLLVLDDLGTQSATPWAEEKLYQLFNYRYNARLPTIITMAKDADLKPRLKSLLLDVGRCTPYEIMAPSYRGLPARNIADKRPRGGKK